MIKKQVSFFACLSVFSCAAFAANVFYVSPKGVDEGATGAKDNPFGTLRAAYAAAKKSGAPAEIVLADGEYFHPETGVEMDGYPNASASLKIRAEGSRCPAANRWPSIPSHGNC